ncbi:nitroreductase [Fusobacterium sp. CAG:439]|nr:nitroreductase [Fusobacterium sp. CAG:439]
MFEIDKEKCIHCGLCVKDCSPKALQFNDEKIPVIDEKKML